MTIEEILTAVASDAALKTKLVSSFKDDFVKGAEAEGLIVRTKEQDQTYVQSQVDAILPTKVEEKFNVKFKENLDAMDSIVTEAGYMKGAHEKTTDFIKRAFADLKSKGADPTAKDRIAELEKLMGEKENGYKSKLGELEKSLFSKEIDWQLSGSLDNANIFVPTHLKTDEEKQAYINQEKNLMKLGFMSAVTAKKDESGNVVFYEGDKLLVSTKDGKPLKAGEILQSKFSGKFLQPGQQGAGSGHGKAGGEGGAGGNGFKTVDDIHKHLAASGIAVSSQEYQDQLSKIATDNSISI